MVAMGVISSICGSSRPPVGFTDGLGMPTVKCSINISADGEGKADLSFQG